MKAKWQLGVFLRLPRYGTVKKRLARDIGAGEALRFYRRSSSDVIRRLGADRRWQVALIITPDHHRPVRVGRIWPGARRGLARARACRQGGGDLGQRLRRAMLRGAIPGRAGPMLIIGSDIPDLASSHARAAFAALGADLPFLVGADDGGYWLIGLRRRPARIERNRAFLAGVRWSGPHALADSMTSLPCPDMVEFLPVLPDIDDGADYLAWRGSRKPAGEK